VHQSAYSRLRAAHHHAPRPHEGFDPHHIESENDSTIRTVTATEAKAPSSTSTATAWQPSSSRLKPARANEFARAS
jgi:hypothetical protein